MHHCCDYATQIICKNATKQYNKASKPTYFYKRGGTLMNWLDTITYILYGCGVLIILLFAVNLILAKKRGEDSKWVRRALYVVAFIAAVLGAIRAKAVYSESVFFADLLVIFCLIVAFVRSEKPQQPPEDDDQQ